jgi:hypothetical protein
MTKRIKGWIVERPGVAMMEMEYIAGKKEPAYVYKIYPNLEDASRMNVGHDPTKIKEAMLIYKE